MKKTSVSWLAAGLLMIVIACAKQESATPAVGGILAVSVTEKGFEPSHISAKKGAALTIVVTRKTDSTCARNFVLEAAGINQALPLDSPVTLEIKLNEAGSHKFGCAMGKMVGGTIHVE